MNEIADVHVASWHATYPGLIPQAHIDRRTPEYRVAQWEPYLRDESNIAFVACEDDGTIVGFASAGPSSEAVDGFDGELYALYLAPSAWRRGIGSALVHAAGEALHAAGFGSAWVRVLTENHRAVEFYKKTGAEFICDTEETIDGALYREQFYGWRDVTKM